MPCTQAGAASQHGSPRLPHAPPLPHAVDVAVHKFVTVSQHPVVHVFSAQHTSLTSPHATHVPATQAWPAVHVLPVQQGSVSPPHAPPQVPAKHAMPLAQVSPTPTHTLVSQHPPPLQMLPAQQANPDAPQAWHTPVEHTLPGAEQAVPCVAHVWLAGSQHPFALQGEAPAQQASPGPPHVA